MRLYHVTDQHDCSHPEDAVHEWAWANSHRQASDMVNELHRYRCDGPGDWRVTLTDYDGKPSKGEPYIETNQDVLRSAGARWEGDCRECGDAEAACGECHCCAGCCECEGEGV